MMLIPIGNFGTVFMDNGKNKSCRTSVDEDTKIVMFIYAIALRTTYLEAGFNQ